MFVLVQAPDFQRHANLLDQMFRLRKRVFADQLGWDVQVEGELERDAYDDFDPAYLIWCDDEHRRVYGGMRLMPTTGPTLLYDVFRRTFPDGASLTAPGIWEGTRMCLDEAALEVDMPQATGARGFCLMLVALCEVALAHGVHTMISNYEPHMRRIYNRAGAEVHELGRAEGFGKHPVCCGAFNVSESVLGVMRGSMNLTMPLYIRRMPLMGAAVPFIGLAA